MNNLNILDNVLLSENVFEHFGYVMNDLEFSNWLTTIIPEVIDCANLKQDNPWHIYNCMEHILRGVEEVNKQTQGLPDDDRRLLAYSMFYHDMGKPACHIRRFGKISKQ